MQVTFHFNVPDKLVYTSRLVRKARARQARLVICGDEAELAQLSSQLWALTPESFLAHAPVRAPDHMVRHSPVLLVPHPRGDEAADVLVNLGQEMPSGRDGFARVIEIVSFGEADRAQARVRWRAYVASGVTPARHDAAAQQESA